MMVSLSMSMRDRTYKGSPEKCFLYNMMNIAGNGVYPRSRMERSAGMFSDSVLFLVFRDRLRHMALVEIV